MQAAFQRARLVDLAARHLNRDEPGHGLAVTRNQNLFARLNPKEQLGKVGLGVMDVDFHNESLA